MRRAGRPPAGRGARRPMAPSESSHINSPGDPAIVIPLMLGMAPKTARKSRPATARTERKSSRAAPRAIWRGTLSLGMVAIPVTLYTATESHDVRFHLLHKADGVR